MIHAYTHRFVCICFYHLSFAVLRENARSRNLSITYIDIIRIIRMIAVHTGTVSRRAYMIHKGELAYFPCKCSRACKQSYNTSACTH